LHSVIVRSCCCERGIRARVRHRCRAVDCVRVHQLHGHYSPLPVRCRGTTGCVHFSVGGRRATHFVIVVWCCTVSTPLPRSCLQTARNSTSREERALSQRRLV